MTLGPIYTGGTGDGTVMGTGSAGQVAFWTGMNTISGDPNLTFGATFRVGVPSILTTVTESDYIKFTLSSNPVLSTNYAIGALPSADFSINVPANHGFVYSSNGVSIIDSRSQSPLTLTQTGTVSAGTNGTILGLSSVSTFVNWNPGAGNTASVNFNLANTISFADAVGNQTQVSAFIIAAPTYAYTSVSHTITAASTINISAFPTAGTNASFTFNSGLVIGNLAGIVGTGATNADAVFIMPGIANGITNTTSNYGLLVTGGAGSVLLGDQAANTSNLSGVSVSSLTFARSSGVNTRTITGIASGISSAAPVAGTGVSFTNTPLAFYASSGISRFDAGILVNVGGSSTPTIGFNSDTTTGFYRSSAGYIGLSSAGSASFIFGLNSSYSQLRVPNKFALESSTGTRYIDFDPNGNFSFTSNISIGVQFNQPIGFFGHAVHAQQTLTSQTNNVAPSGTANQLDDFTSLIVYATDAQAIHNDIYNLGVAVNAIITLLKGYGLSA